MPILFHTENHSVVSNIHYIVLKSFVSLYNTELLPNFVYVCACVCGCVGVCMGVYVYAEFKIRKSRYYIGHMTKYFCNIWPFRKVLGHALMYISNAS